MDELEFYMDVSPKWWIKSRKDESSALKNTFVKNLNMIFIQEIISKGKQKIDVDKENPC